MGGVAALLVTHNSRNWINQTLASINAQDRQPDFRIAIDDASTDDTVAILRENGFRVVQGATNSSDTSTRIARNFAQGVRAAQAMSADIVILGDHDDVWLLNRISHQVAMLEEYSQIAMLASDGRLIDESGAPTQYPPATLRSTFPVPADFTDRSVRDQLTYALRHSVATGGASALRPARMQSIDVPAGWLHDRWWSLQAIRAGNFLIDPTVVIDYRVTSDQQVGLDTRDQDDPKRWLLRQAGDVGRTAKRSADLLRLLPPRS